MRRTIVLVQPTNQAFIPCHNAATAQLYAGRDAEDDPWEVCSQETEISANYYVIEQGGDLN